jgi:hypothetical protein
MSLVDTCPDCGAPVEGVVAQTVFGGRLEWSVSSRCAACGSATEECGRDDMPVAYRRALIEDVGLARLRIEPAAERVQVLRVLRAAGASMTEAVERWKLLTDEGLTGTPEEVRLLVQRLTDAGVARSRLLVTRSSS